MATMRQRKAFKEVLNGSTITKAMVNAGYSETTASTTGKLTSTDGWKELMQQHMPDSVLAKKHREMLNKKEKLIVSDGAREGSHIEDTGQPHSDVNKALDMAFKLKGYYPRDEDMGNRTLIIQVSGETAERYGILPTPRDTKTDSAG